MAPTLPPIDFFYSDRIFSRTSCCIFGLSKSSRNFCVMKSTPSSRRARSAKGSWYYEARLNRSDNQSQFDAHKEDVKKRNAAKKEAVRAAKAARAAAAKARNAARKATAAAKRATARKKKNNTGRKRKATQAKLF